MQTGIITCIDSKLIPNFKVDFLDTIRKDAEYNGNIYLIYYGRNKRFENMVKNSGVKVFRLQKKSEITNQRYKDLIKILPEIPRGITHLILVDGGDVWFQKPISKIFSLSKNSYGFCEEDIAADQGFNFEAMIQIKNLKTRSLFLNKVKDKKLINGGMIAGKREKINFFCKEIVNYLKKINQDFFGLDQAILNYLIRSDNSGINLPQEFNYSLISKQNGFKLKNGKIFDNEKGLVALVHNSGSKNRLFPKGRESIKEIPVFPEKLEGEFWGITAFFNPVKYKNKPENYRKFRQASKRQGLKLLAVECAFLNAPFELKKDDADFLIQVRSNSVLWQKERLINIGIENLPKNCDKFAWLDSDIIFLNDNWVKDTSKLLESYAAVQPFSTYLRMKRGIKAPDRDKIKKIPFSGNIDVDGKRFFGVGYRVSQLGKKIMEKNIHDYGQVGLAWAARRSVFEGSGIFDKSAFPVVDMLMAHLFYNNKLTEECNYYINKNIKKSLLNWSKRVYPKIRGSVFYTEGEVLHLWHGAMKDRNYEICRRILNNYNFDPEVDIKISENGSYEWASGKENMQMEMKNYFKGRNEEGRFFINMGKFFNFRKFLYLRLDRALGLAGKFIKKISPAGYSRLKKIEAFLRKNFRGLPS